MRRRLHATLGVNARNEQRLEPDCRLKAFFDQRRRNSGNGSSVAA